eukprot:scaffold186223_cov18-Tisochrysis_lutea.AAC.1
MKQDAYESKGQLVGGQNKVARPSKEVCTSSRNKALLMDTRIASYWRQWVCTSSRDQANVARKEQLFSGQMCTPLRDQAMLTEAKGLVCVREQLLSGSQGAAGMCLDRSINQTFSRPLLHWLDGLSQCVSSP